MKYLARNLKYLREQKGLKQSQLKIVIGFQSTTWNNYEKGKSKPGLDDLVKISRFFGYPENELLHKNLAAGDGAPKKGSYRSREEEIENQNILNEEEVDYKKLSKSKDKIITDNERIIAAQHRQIETLKSMVSHLEVEVQKLSKTKK